MCFLPQNSTFPVSLQSASSIYNRFQVIGAQGPRSHQREVLPLTIKILKCNSGQGQLSPVSIGNSQGMSILQA